MRLYEIPNRVTNETPASFEPTIDYESLQKAIRSLDLDIAVSFANDPIDLISVPTDKRLSQIYSALKNGHTIEEISRNASIDPFFIRKISNIVDFETYLLAKYGNGKAKKMGAGDLRRAKRLGFTDEQIAELTGFTRERVTDLRHERTHDTQVTPLTLEDVMNIIEKEEPEGVLVQFGGQTSVNLAIPLEREIERRGLSTRILGTSPNSIDIAEDRDRFSRLLKQLAIPQPESGSATSRDDAIRIAREIGFPLLVRPSYVLGGRAMEIVYDESELDRYIEEAVKVSRQHPVLIDKFLQHAVEIDVDAVSDGDHVLVPAIMEHIEEAGIHSGDSAVVIPAQSIDDRTQEIIKDYVTKIAKALNVVGLINLQMAIKDDTVFVLEANPRSSRTIPYVSKATGLPLAKIAAKVIIGHRLSDLCPTEPTMKHVAVKEVVLPFEKLPGVDPILGPEMKSTGEVMGIDYDFGRAFYKAALACESSRR